MVCLELHGFRFERSKNVFVKTKVISLFNHAVFHHLVEIPGVLLKVFICKSLNV